MTKCQEVERLKDDQTPRKFQKNSNDYGKKSSPPASTGRPDKNVGPYLVRQ